MKANYERKDLFYGVTKYPNGSDYLLVFSYYVLDINLSKTFGEITWKYKNNELMNKLFDSLNVINNKDYDFTTFRITDSSNE